MVDVTDIRQQAEDAADELTDDPLRLSIQNEDSIRRLTRSLVFHGGMKPREAQATALDMLDYSPHQDRPRIGHVLDISGSTARTHTQNARERRERALNLAYMTNEPMPGIILGGVNFNGDVNGEEGQVNAIIKRYVNGSPEEDDGAHEMELPVEEFALIFNEYQSTGDWTYSKKYVGAQVERYEDAESVVTAFLNALEEYDSSLNPKLVEEEARAVLGLADPDWSRHRVFQRPVGDTVPEAPIR